MTNIRITPQDRGCMVGRKYIPFYNVVADTERFGRNGIMYQGDFDGCLRYLKDNLHDYLTEVMKRNRKTDIQIAERMYSILDQEDTILHLKSRDGFCYKVDLLDMVPVAPNTFRLPYDPANRERKSATVKFMDARAW